MKFRYSPAVWLSKDFYGNHDMYAPFAPINQIQLYLRGKDEQNTNNASAVHNYHCIYFCLEGEGIIEINNIPYMMKKNEAIGVLPRSPHCRIHSNSHYCWLLARFVPADPGSINHLFEVKLQLREENDVLIQNLIDAYENLADLNDPQRNNEVALKLSLVINSLDGCAQKNDSAKKTGKWRVDEAVNLLLSKGNANLSLQEIARCMNITRGHLTDMIHDALGYPPRHIRRMARLRMAQNLLEYTYLSISEIAEAVGFKSVYAFSNFFKHIYGINPTAYRKKYRKQQ